MDGPPPTESTVNDQVDVVLPVLDEAEAIGWVLPRLPDGWRAIVVASAGAVLATLGCSDAADPEAAGCGTSEGVVATAAVAVFG